MPKGLLKYTGKKAKDKESDRTVSEFLTYTKPGKLLLIGSSIAYDAVQAEDRGFDVTAVDTDFASIREAKPESRKVDFRTDFFAYAKTAPKDSFDVIIDSGFSHTLKRSKVERFFHVLAKLLKHNGTLFVKAYSDEDDYAKEHCPKRKWTTIDGKYFYFFSNEELQGIIRKHGYDIASHSQVDEARRSHAVEARLKATKL
jgi:cyclopropane fatty-acyl-phospholipid synthase-like methyltransferase